MIEQLDGYEVPAGAWEREVLAARCEEYDPALLDSSRSPAGWPGDGSRRRRRAMAWPTEAGPSGRRPWRSSAVSMPISGSACLRREPTSAVGLWAGGARGDRTTGRLVPSRAGAGSGLLPTQVEQALGELAALGLVTSDSFAGLRALLTPSDKRRPIGVAHRRHRTVPFGIETAGRWSMLKTRAEGDGERTEVEGQTLDSYARILLQRYGVVFHRLLARESLSVPWRQLLLIYRRLEARGEIRGGRFVAGVTGEQFALPDAVAKVRAVRREQDAPGHLVAISAADPLNLVGIVTPGDRVPALAAESHRL